MEIPIGFEDWEETLRIGAAFFDLTLTDQQIRLFYRHAETLWRWNQTTNLTAIRDPREMAIKHFVDSIGPVNDLMPMNRVLDAGSGGGFPGLPIKVCCASIDLTLVDAVRKKTSFLQHVIRELKLSGATVIHERVEELSRRSHLPLFDTIVCRAFSDLSFVIRHLAPLLAEGGKIVVWKGRMPEQEIRDVQPLLEDAHRAFTLALRSYRLPILDAERTLVIVTAGR